MDQRTINNRYEIARSLGRGSSGEVFLARDAAKGSAKVALKVLDRVDPGRMLVESLRHEFSLLSHLSHPNLVEVYDFGFLDGTDLPFFTEEYIEGPDLFGAFERLSAEEVLDVTVQVLRGLEYIHSRGFLHRDIKPQNILVSLGGKKPRAKILDLSLAGPGTGESGGAVRGSVLYLAPEVIRGGEIDRRSDLYSLGITLHHVISRKPPYAGQSVRDVIRQHLEADLPPLASPPLAFMSDILVRMTAKDPAARFPSADAVITALNKASGSSFNLQTSETRRSAIRSMPLVGRSRHLANLREWLDSRATGSAAPAVYFLEGPSGSGKTALLKEFRNAVQMSNARWMEGNRPRPLETPYWGFQKVIEEAVGMLGRDSDIVAAYEPSLVRLNSSLSRDGQVPARQGPMDEGNKLRLHSEVSRFMLKAAVRTPICLCFDDFDRADRGTFDLTGALVRSLGEPFSFRDADQPGQKTSPLAIVLSYNPEKLPDDRYGLMRGNFKEPLCRRIALGDLDREGVSSLIRAAIPGAAVPQGFEKRMYDLTGGNPGLVVSTLESLMDTGGIVRDGGAWSVAKEAAETFSLPPDVATVLLARFRRLPAAARVGLRVLGLSSADMPGPLMTAIIGRCGVDPIEAVSSLLEEGFLARRAHAGEVRYAMDDPAWAAVASRITDGPAEAEMHRIIGEETEKHCASPSYEVSAALAEHFTRAGEVDKALGHVFKAAEGFSQMGAFKTALMAYTKGLELAAGGDLRLRDTAVELLFRRAGVHRVLGRYSEALEDLENAQRIAEEAGSQRLVAQALGLLSELNLQWGKYFMTEVLATRAHHLASLSGDKPNLLLAETLLGMLALRRGEYVTAEQRLSAAEDLSRETGRPADTARILMEISGARQRLGKLHEALSNLRSALALYRTGEDAQGIAGCLASIGNTHFLMGEYDDALSHYRKALKIHGESGDVGGTISVNYSIGNILLQIGLFPSARKYFETSLSLARTFDLPGQVALNKAGIAFLDLMSGRLGTALGLFTDSLAIYESIGARSGSYWAQNGIGIVHTRLNQFDKARETFYRVARDVEETGEIRVFADVLMNLADLEIRAGDAKKAEDFARRSLAQARKGSLRDFEMSFRQVMGEIALASGDLGRAHGEFTAAGELARAMRIESSAAESDVSIAAVLLAMGKPEAAIETAERGLAQARRENYNQVVVRGAAAAGEGHVALGDFGRAAYFIRTAVEKVFETLKDIDSQYHERFLADKARLFERSRWLIEKLTQTKAGS